MASTITAGNATNGLALSCDNTGILELKTGTGAGTTAMTIGTGQQVAVTLGSAAAPAITFSGDTNTGIFSPAADTIAFAEGGVESARIDASGNLLVNTTTKFGRVTSENSTAFDPTVSGNIVNTAFTARGSYSGGVSVIDSSGNQGYSMWSQAGGADFFIRRATTTGSYTGGVFISNAAGSWSSASDERLKNIHRPIENAADKLSGLRCVFGEYKDNPGIEHPFLIAQDVQVVFPEVVNEFDKENGYLGMSYTDMVPILVKAIQEQQQMIETLQAKVAALEAK